MAIVIQEHQSDLFMVCLGPGWGGGGVLLYLGYIGMCGAKGYGVLAVLVRNGRSTLTILGRDYGRVDCT